jgi:hypothetical protein
LQYAPRPSLRRPKIVRRAVLLVVFAGVVAAGVWWLPRVRDRALLYALQRQCMNHSPPADEVVYAQGVERAAALMSDARYRHFAGPPQAAFFVPNYWSDFYAALSRPGFKSHGTVFLGEIQTPSGERRLVGVDLVIDSSTEVLLTARVVEPGSLLKPPRLLTTGIYRFPSAALLERPVKPAHVNPQDPTHVVLFGGRIEGWLRDDETHDYVELYQRDLTPPAPSSQASPPTSAAPATRPSASPGAR